jgi:hypothetical protein
MNHVKIELTGPSTGKVWVDGVEQENLVAVSFDVGISSPALVELVQRIHPTTLEIDGPMDVTVLDNQGARTFVEADSDEG